MLLSKPAIERHMADGNITIDPFVPENLGSAQYDVTLGQYCFREVERTAAYHSPLYNPFDEKHVRTKWVLDQAIKHEDYIERSGRPLEGVGLDEEIIIIAPGETILAHTEEFIGGSCDFITTMMKARSSTGRNFIEVCKCAGMGDVGYFNRWTMEITNNSRYHNIPLVRKRRVAQLLFFQVEPVKKSDNYAASGKYQTSKSLAELRASWTPGEMLPKQWKDRETKKARGELSTCMCDCHRNNGGRACMCCGSRP